MGFLYAEDAAIALYLLGEMNKCGIYNLAFGDSRQLKEFIIEARDLICPSLKLDFNSKMLSNIVELRANVDKIKNDTGWKPTVSFKDGILKMGSVINGENL